MAENDREFFEAVTQGNLARVQELFPTIQFHWLNDYRTDDHHSIDDVLVNAGEEQLEVVRFLLESKRFTDISVLAFLNLIKYKHQLGEDLVSWAAEKVKLHDEDVAHYRRFYFMFMSALRKAIADEDLVAVRILLRVPNTEFASYYGASNEFMAEAIVRSGDRLYEIAKFLFERGAYPVCAFTTLAHEAVRHGDVETLTKLLTEERYNAEGNLESMEPNHLDENRESPIGLLIRLYSPRTDKESMDVAFAMLDVLVEYGGHTGSVEGLNDTMISLAIRKGNVHLVRHMLEGGASLVERDMFGYYPLAIAVAHGDLDIIRLVLDKYNEENYDIGEDRISMAQNSVIHEAVRQGNDEMILMLRRGGAPMDQRNALNLDPMEYAERNERKELMSLNFEMEGATPEMIKNIKKKRNNIIRQSKKVKDALVEPISRVYTLKASVLRSMQKHMFDTSGLPELTIQRAEERRAMNLYATATQHTQTRRTSAASSSTTSSSGSFYSAMEQAAQQKEKEAAHESSTGDDSTAEDDEETKKRKTLGSSPEKQGREKTRPSESQIKAILRACKHGNVSLVRSMLQEEPALHNVRTGTGKTLSEYAKSQGQHHIASLFSS